MSVDLSGGRFWTGSGRAWGYEKYIGWSREEVDRVWSFVDAIYDYKLVWECTLAIQCPFAEVALHINGRSPVDRIVRYRLKIGK